MERILWTFSRPACSECQALAEELKTVDVPIRKIDGQYLSGELGIPQNEDTSEEILEAMIAIQVDCCDRGRFWPPPLPVGVLQDNGLRVGYGKDEVLALVR